MNHFRCLRLFCKKNPLQNSSKPTKQSMMYDAKAFEKVNDKNFIKKMEKMEKLERGSRSKSNKVLAPVFLATLSVGIYGLWQQLPYSKMFKHFTLNEYTFQKGYLHTIPLSCLSFQSDGHFLVYFPLMAYAFVLNSTYLSNRRVLSVFLINSIVSAIAAYLYEKTYQNYLTQTNHLMTPKTNGAVTSLCFISLFFAMKPNHLVFGSKGLPFFIIPATYYMYEWSEFRGQHVNEISRMSHFSAILFGLLSGVYFKRIL